MAPLFPLLFLLALLPHLTTAAFDIFWIIHTVRHPEVGFQILDPSQSNCPDPSTTRFFPNSNDVSDKKIGVRCEGTGCLGWHPTDYYNPRNIDVMEMHLSESPVLHWTIYKLGHPGRPWQMFGPDRKSVGWCEPTPGDDEWFAQCGDYSGHRKMRCHTSYTADFINARDRGW